MNKGASRIKALRAKMTCKSPMFTPNTEKRKPASWATSRPPNKGPSAPIKLTVTDQVAKYIVRFSPWGNRP